MESFITVGIDVGTTSTHLTLSRLFLENSSSVNQAPRLAIGERETLHEGEVYLTPLTKEGIIDADRVFEILQKEYAAAGMTSADVKVGAAIITGETARKRNAEQVAHVLSQLAGELVAATAGPHLEGVLAARGAGAVRSSLERKVTILNMDIGGGTVNLTVVREGQIIDTACIGLGGRFLKLSSDHAVEEITANGQEYLKLKGYAIKVGDPISDDDLHEITALLSADIMDAVSDSADREDSEISESADSEIVRLLFTTEPLRHRDFDEVWLTGGVAEFISQKHLKPDCFGDVGGYLARAFLTSLEKRAIRYSVPARPIRATVIGAGMFSMQVSGSTIHVEFDALPIRNVPVVRPFVSTWSSDFSNTTECIENALRHSDIQWSEQIVALELPHIHEAGYINLKVVAKQLANAARKLSASSPLVFICEQDVAMALGQLIRQYLRGESLLVIDGVSSLHGDYIDIGKPVARGISKAVQSLPVIVKTLVF
ncbi:MAG TPA: ethanolamine ammonia-lyase reactivating factor EutA [Candidatus Obscuribacterales bacterium]